MEFLLYSSITLKVDFSKNPATKISVYCSKIFIVVITLLRMVSAQNTKILPPKILSTNVSTFQNKIETVLWAFPSTFSRRLLRKFIITKFKLIYKIFLMNHETLKNLLDIFKRRCKIPYTDFHVVHTQTFYFSTIQFESFF